MDERNEKLTSLSSELLKYLQAQQHNPTPEFVNFIAGQCKAAQNMPCQYVIEAAQLALNEFSNSSVASNVSTNLPIDFSHFTLEQFEQLQEQVLARVRDIVAKFAAEDTEHKVFADGFDAENDVTFKNNKKDPWLRIFLYAKSEDRELMRFLKRDSILWIGMLKPVTDRWNYDPEYDWYQFKSLDSIDALELKIKGLIEYYKLMDIKKQFEGW